VRRIFLLSLLALIACKPARVREPELGNAAHGKELIVKHECWDCHIIPGVDLKPGPGVPTSLDGFADSTTLCNDDIENTRANLEKYIQKPKSVYPQARMPGIGDAPEEARDIAAYLMTLD
jgi:cytochrome c2